MEWKKQIDEKIKQIESTMYFSPKTQLSKNKYQHVQSKVYQDMQPAQHVAESCEI